VQTFENNKKLFGSKIGMKEPSRYQPMMWKTKTERQGLLFKHVPLKKNHYKKKVKKTMMLQ